MLDIHFVSTLGLVKMVLAMLSAPGRRRYAGSVAAAVKGRGEGGEDFPRPVA